MAYDVRSGSISDQFVLPFLPLGDLFLGRALGFFFGVAFVVEEEKALEDFLAGVGVNGEADAVVLGKIVDLVEVVAQVDGGAPLLGILVPAVGRQNGFVH